VSASIRVTVIEGSRVRRAFHSPVAGWRYRITTGPQCGGLMSCRQYKTDLAAFAAGVRMVEKLKILARQIGEASACQP
jgi:hypothetical protein